MIRHTIALVVATCAALVIGAADRAFAVELAGDYALAGQSASGANYQGGMSIIANGRTFRVSWNRPAPLPQQGYALQLGNVLGVVAARSGVEYGIAMYRVKGGTLEGVWRGDNGRKARLLGQEQLDGPEGLEGRFDITIGRNGDGSPYSGHVEIKKSGALYLVDWFTPAPGYVGIGVLVNDILVVSYGPGERLGIAAYCLGAEPVIEGITGLPTETALGAEVIWPHDKTAVSDSARRLAEIRALGRPGCGTPIGGLEVAPDAQTVTSR
jgi:hypothetical protein